MGFQGEHLIKELQQIAVCDLILGQELGFSCGRIHLFQWKAPYLHGTNHCKTVLRHSLLEFNNKAFKLQTIILISLYIYIYVYTHIYIYLYIHMLSSSMPITGRKPRICCLQHPFNHHIRPQRLLAPWTPQTMRVANGRRCANVQPPPASRPCKTPLVSRHEKKQQCIGKLRKK